MKDILYYQQKQYQEKIQHYLRKYDNLFFRITQIAYAIKYMSVKQIHDRDLCDFRDKCELIYILLDQLLIDNGHDQGGYVTFENFIKSPNFKIGYKAKENPFEDERQQLKKLLNTNLTYKLGHYGTFFGKIPEDTKVVVKIKNLIRDLRNNYLAHPKNRNQDTTLNPKLLIVVSNIDLIIKIIDIYKSCCKKFDLYTSVNLFPGKMPVFYDLRFLGNLRRILMKLQDLKWILKIKIQNYICKKIGAK